MATVSEQDWVVNGQVDYLRRVEGVELRSNLERGRSGKAATCASLFGGDHPAEWRLIHFKLRVNIQSVLIHKITCLR